MSTAVAVAETPVETVEKKPSLRIAFHEAARKEAPAIAEVFQRAFADKNEFGDPTDYIARTIGDSDNHVVVAEAPTGKLAGFIMASFNSFARKGLHIDQLAVDPDFQGHGIGRKLLQQAEAIAIADKRRAMTLHVRENNEGAIHLYESFGFAKLHKVPGYYRDGTGAFEMQKNLPRPANDNTGWKAVVPKFVKNWLGL